MADRVGEVERWLPAARAGCAEALGQALEACRGYLLLVAQRELHADLRAKGGASDLVQETFLEAQRDFMRFQGGAEAELLAWLRRILLNNLANFTRSYRETDKRQVGREVTLPHDRAPSPRGGGLAAEAPSPSGEALADERAEAVRRALDRLPEDYRRVVLLRYREERPFEEIAQLLGRSANAVRRLWLRAVERLRLELGGAP
jgi:RNA polymerase sigma-70 factor (ECF subfamily)